jgi:hypothetical protein
MGLLDSFRKQKPAAGSAKGRGPRVRRRLLDFQRGEITVCVGNGDKDRVTMMPQAVNPSLHPTCYSGLCPLPVG